MCVRGGVCECVRGGCVRVWACECVRENFASFCLCATSA